MRAHCDSCGADNELMDSNDDRANWEPINEQQVVIDPVVGSVVRAVPVAARLTFVCGECGETGVIEEPLEPQLDPE